MSRIRYSLMLFATGFLNGCGLVYSYQQGGFTRDALPLLADDLRDATDLAVAVKPELADSPYVTLARGVADRWDGYYDSGQEVSYELIFQEANQLAGNIEAAIVAQGADPATAARVRAIAGVVLRRLERLAPPEPVPGVPTTPKQPPA